MPDKFEYQLSLSSAVSGVLTLAKATSTISNPTTLSKFILKYINAVDKIPDNQIRFIVSKLGKTESTVELPNCYIDYAPVSRYIKYLSSAKDRQQLYFCNELSSVDFYLSNHIGGNRITSNNTYQIQRLIVKAYETAKRNKQLPEIGTHMGKSINLVKKELKLWQSNQTTN